MSKTKQKIASFGLSIATIVTFSGSLMPIASAQTTADLQAQIAALLAQIQQLQAQLSSNNGGSMSSSYNFTRNLTLGSTGEDVKALQQFLNANGYTVATSGAGSAGNESTYFGTLTKNALAKFQAAKNISPAVGYFGPITMSAIKSMGGGSGSTGGNGGGSGNTGGGPTIPGTGLTVSLASGENAGGSLISSGSSAAARVPVLTFNLTAGTASGMHISDLKFNKTGVVSDTSISSAYLVDNGQVVGQYTSISNGVIDFANVSMDIAAGQTKKLTLAIDPATGLSAGNTIGFAINSASNVTATDASSNSVTANGTFPMTGGVFTVTSVSNPSIASVTIASSSVGTTTYAGTKSVLVSQWTTTVNNSPVKLGSINFKVVGSANKADIRNLVLKVNGVEAGTLAQVAGDGSAYFDMTSKNVQLNTGSSNIQIYADVMGSPSFNFDFGILNSYDVYVVDTEYNVPVTTTVNGGGTGSSSGHQITINQGQVTLTVDTATPTGNIALGGSGTTLAKFDFYAAGEAIKTKFLDVVLTKVGGTHNWSSGDPNLDIKNIQLVDDAGIQIGSTISTIASGTSSGQCTYSSSTVLTCHFGTSGSNINYIVPANTTRVITVKADIQSTADFSSVVVSLPGNSSNLQGLTSSQTSSSGSTTASSLTLSSTPISVTKNGALSNQTYAKGATNVKIGSYVFTASSAEAVNVNNFTITTNSSSTYFQNLKAMVGTSQIGTTYPTISASNYTFSGAFNVPSGGTTIVDIYADILTSTTGAMGSVTTFASLSGTGASTYSSVSYSTTQTGQTITVSSGPSITISNNNSLSSRQVVMGSTGVSLGKVLLTDTAGIEAIRIQQLKFTINTGSAVGQAFSNLKLYDSTGSAIAGAGPVSMTSAAPSFVADFNFGNAATVTVPQAGTLALELKGDVSGYTVGSNIENATSAIAISATSSVVAYGKSSNASVTVSGTPSFATLTSLRSKLNLSGVALGTDSACNGVGGVSTTNRSRTSNDYVACIKLANDSAGGDVQVNTLALRFSGAALSTSAFNVTLYDGSNIGTVYDGSSTKSCSPTGNSCAVTFSFSGTSITGTKGVAVLVDSSGFFNNSTTAQTEGLDITLNAATDVSFSDGTITGTTGLNLSSDVAVPLTLAHVDYN